MKSVKLSVSIRNKLISLPETGMGYQIVNVLMKDGNTIKGLKVLNCENLIIKNHKIDSDSIADVVLC